MSLKFHNEKKGFNHKSINKNKEFESVSNNSNDCYLISGHPER